MAAANVGELMQVIQRLNDLSIYVDNEGQIPRRTGKKVWIYWGFCARIFLSKAAYGAMPGSQTTDDGIKFVWLVPAIWLW